jgi:hypothetical protein
MFGIKYKFLASLIMGDHGLVCSVMSLEKQRVP